MEGVAGNECVSREGTVSPRRFLGAQSRDEGQVGRNGAGQLPPPLCADNSPTGLREEQLSPRDVRVHRAGFKSHQCHFPACDPRPVAQPL